MKVETRHTKLTVFLLLVLTGGLLAAQPETADLREPEAIEVVVPTVPYAFSRHHVSGSVDVTFRIDAEGRTRDIEVVNATHREYAQSVENALRQWRFEQPEQEGIKYLLPVKFN